MGCGTELVKILLILLNILCLVSSLVMSALGILGFIYTKNVLYMEEMIAIRNISIIALSLGGSVFLISILGCLGSLQEKPGPLRVYSLVMLVLFLCQITFVIYFMASYADILKNLLAFVNISWDQRNTKGEILHTLEEHLHCCGFDGFMDYSKKHEGLPGSCCGYSAEKSCPKAKFTKGCSQVITELWSLCEVKYAQLILSGLMFTSSIFASYLAYKLRSSFVFNY